MNPLRKILSQSNSSRYATASEIRSHVGRPLALCQLCGSPVRSILHNGSLACPDCQPGPRALLLASVDGLAVELDKNLNPVRSSPDDPLAESTINPTAAESADPALAAVLAWLAISIVELILDSPAAAETPTVAGSQSSPSPPQVPQAVLWTRPETSTRRQAELVDAMNDRNWRPAKAAKTQRVRTRNPNLTK